jgi:ribonuclease D
MEYTYIENDHAINKFRQHLQRREIGVISMDFEGEFNLHCYGEKLCLIQVFDGEAFYVIDPFKISQSELKKTLEDRVAKLFYDASSDRMLVYRQYGIKISSILDLKVIVDTLDFEKKGLDAVQSELLNVEAINKKKFQRYNWMRRPIDQDAVLYALSDVAHLFQLKDELLRLVVQRELVEQLALGFARVNIDYEKVGVPTVKRKREYKQLRAAQRRTFDTVFEMREAVAKRLNRPPHNVIVNEQLFGIATGALSINNVRFGQGISSAVKTETQDKLSRILNET